MRNYTKYRIVKELGKYYVEIPLLWIFWERLWYVKVTEHQYRNGIRHERLAKYREFDSEQSAREFAENNKYVIIK